MPYIQHAGRHEFGQNFLVDRSVIDDFVELVARTDGPIVEIGAGDGALTLPLSRQGRELTAVEIDSKRSKRLSRQTPDNVTVVCADVLSFRFPQYPHVVVGNIPFHVTTPIVRALLAADHWHTAVLLVQWEVARRRAGVGGATLLTASWWPWYDFELHSRVPARAFRPVPSVDGGLFSMVRRGTPLVDDRRGYQEFVRLVFTGKGHGLPEILQRTGRIARKDQQDWQRANRVGPQHLPKDLTAHQWASLWHLVAPGRPAGPRRPAPRRPGSPASARRR
ncbi:23S ribosomal RNA methyltransferase Erm [Micromonospora carbonacea]|uniref:23S rRNA (Adenine-N6)-dimethyltransferase n=1 Tax=Micromonospora carbonacea TaxID=47853 RepID=A0A1C5ARI8_9ACTN|nr:23S ribosomal RNA methyltransferase Erm [Micromonospora carbonacea]SCF47756.1 23S rRNA (adenine-N6)-dimethyltransferase [Micromonospora carbonacea]